jgi:hypothetical protein
VDVEVWVLWVSSVSQPVSLEEIVSGEWWRLHLLGVDIGVGVELTVNGGRVDKPAVTGVEDGDGPRVEGMGLEANDGDESSCTWESMAPT